MERMGANKIVRDCVYNKFMVEENIKIVMIYLSGESAIAFASALNKPDANMYFIFCIGSMQDKIKIQYAMRYALVWNVRIRIYDFNDGTWSNWH